MKKRAFTFMVALVGVAALVLAQDQTKQPPTVVVPKGKAVSPKEAAAIKKISDAKTDDERIAAVESLITNFADTSFKGAALYEAAEAADHKQDYVKAISYGDLSIEADPKAGTAMNAMLLVAGELAQHTPKYSLTKEEDLGKAEKYVNQALEMLPTITKPEGVKVSDADWEGFKKDKTVDAHRDLGLIATARGKWDVAATEFKLAVDGSSGPDSVLMARLGNAYNEAGKYSDAQAILKKVLGLPNLNPSVKAFADAELARAEKNLKGK
jgi:tetratricopeptide (TPR) repeat protein